MTIPYYLQDQPITPNLNDESSPGDWCTMNNPRFIRVNPWPMNGCTFEEEFSRGCARIKHGYGRVMKPSTSPHSYVRFFHSLCHM